MFRLIRRLVFLAIVLIVVAGGAYAYFCRPIGFLHKVDDQQHAVIVARVVERLSGGEYAVADPTGRTWVRAKSAPSVGTYVVIRGRKRTVRGQAVLDEDWRLGTF